MPDARFPGTSTGPGRSASRTDLAPGASLQQPMRIPTGQPYGSAKQVEQMQASRPLQNGQAASAQAVTAAARSISMPKPQPHPGGRFAQQAVQASPQDILGAVGSHPSRFPGRPVNYGVATGTPRVQSAKELLAHVEALMQGAKAVPANVIRLYNGLRAEVAQVANAPRPAQAGPTPVPGVGRPAQGVSPAHPITPATAPAAPPPAPPPQAAPQEPV